MFPKELIMVNKYHVTNLDSFNLDTEGQTYEMIATVDSLDYITLEFGSSFSIRFNYDQAEKLESVLKSARYLIQDNHIDTAGSSISHENEESSDWNPDDPSNW